MLNKVGSDYINANWVDGIDQRSQRKFIATQGPLPNTVEDFWRMVWTYKCSVIVMLTALYESNRQMIKKNKRSLFSPSFKKRQKCVQYWPNKKETFPIYGMWSVEMDSETETSELAERVFIMTEISTGKELSITQIQYLQWPE